MTKVSKKTKAILESENELLLLHCARLIEAGQVFLKKKLNEITYNDIHNMERIIDEILKIKQVKKKKGEE